MKRNNSLLILVLLAALVMNACGQADKKDTKKNTAPIIIGYSQWPGFAAVNIADQKGFFKEEGVSVQVMVFEQYTDSIDSLVAGKIDAFTGSLGDVVTTTANGNPLAMVWALDTPTTAEALVGSRNLSGPADLKGKKVAFLSGGYGHLFVTEILKKYGLSESDIIPVNMSAEQIPAALASGEIDAGHVWEPYVSQSVERGGKLLATAQDTPGLILDGLSFRAEVIKERPEDVQAVVRAVSRAADYWQQNPTEGNSISAQANGIPESDIANVLSGMQIFTMQENRIAFDRTTSDPLSLYNAGRLYVDFFLAQGSIKTSPDLDSLINSSFVQG